MRKLNHRRARSLHARATLRHFVQTNAHTWLVVSGGRFFMRIFLLLLSSCRVLASLLSISSGSRSGRSRRLSSGSGGCADAAAGSSSPGCCCCCGGGGWLSGLSISGEGALSPAREEWTIGGWMDGAAAILSG